MAGKKYQEAAKLIDPKKVYGIDEAVELVKKTNVTKFDATVEVHVRLGIDPKKSDQSIRGTVVLPNGSGKSKTVMAFVTSAKEKEAKEAGADFIGTEETLAEIAKTGKINFDVAVATPDMMPKLAKVAKVLGPKGLMPNPKSDTVSTNVTKMISELKKGKVAFKNDDGAIVHTIIGKASFSAAQLKENYEALMEALRKAKPSNSKGIFIKGATIANTMGPGIRVA
jgi:large subunit ribosomal protein L1